MSQEVLGRKGSTRIIRAVKKEPGVISLEYTDAWSVFDRGPSPQEIHGLGAARCACAVKSFELAGEAGIATHFIRQVDARTIHVHEFAVPGKQSLSGYTSGNVLDAEWIWRIRAYGSILVRLAKGEIKPTDLGFTPSTVVKEGMKLPRMMLECTTKFEPVDRHLSAQEAQSRMGLTDSQWQKAWNTVERIVAVTTAHYEKVGFFVPDGKLELGLTDNGQIIGVDVFGTPDENRIIDQKTGKLHSKDILRNYLKELPWKSELDIAKKSYPNNKSKWPAYPELPFKLTNLVSMRYAEVAERYAGVKI